MDLIAPGTLFVNQEDAKGLYFVDYSYLAMVGAGRFQFLDRTVLYDRQLKIGCDVSNLVHGDNILNFNPRMFSLLENHQRDRFEEYFRGERMPEGDNYEVGNWSADHHFYALLVPDDIAAKIKPVMSEIVQAYDHLNTVGDRFSNTLRDIKLASTMKLEE